MNIQPYLFFGGRCEEALEFYRQTLGAEVDMLLRFRESPSPVPAEMLPPGGENAIMHTSFHIGENVIMASDGCGEAPVFGGFSLSLTVAEQSEAERIFHALSDGGEVTMPLEETFWSPCFGALKDRFGLAWMVGVRPV